MPVQFRSSDSDKTRPCTTCRMMISVLATKCRFCGADVGRAKDEARTMTIEDLGGEQSTRYAPSSTVMEALESFRSEEEMKTAPPEEEPKRGSFIRRRKKTEEARPKAAAAPPEPSGDPGLPQLDERSKALASLAMPSESSSNRYVQSRNAGPGWIRRTGLFAGLVAAMVVLTLGVFQVYAVIRNRQPVPVDTGPQFDNPAKDMLAANEDPLKILEAALDAERREDISENRQVKLEARKRLVEQVEGLLNAEDWNKSLLTSASGIMNQAVTIDPSEEIRELKAEVEKDCFDYQMILDGVNLQIGTATFLLNDPSKGLGVDVEPSEPVTVSEGDMIADRFEVVKIARNYVSVIDSMRGNRYVTYETSGRIR